ncbi:MAG TPA: D-alanyl-D-alanine carboxypeptidase [Candidatus Binatia bacterium]|nr:D-alanyl-D-alanine carboxypeptidase [Candidatus Binatia bacterium]
MKRFLAWLLPIALCACAESHAATTQSALEASPTAAPPYRVAPRQAVHPWNGGDRDRLSSALAADFANASVSGASGVAVVADDGTVVFDLRGNRSMTPASTMKLFVGSTALFTLGQSRRLFTEFKSLSLPDGDGAIDDLWLVGGGDPVLTSDDLVRGVGMLRRAGVRAIRSLNVDASAFAGPEQNPGWLRDDDRYDYAAGTSALSLDWNVVKTVVDGAQVYRPIANIPDYVGGVVRELLKRTGIAIDRVQFGTAPLGATKLWAHPSPTIGELVHQMFYESDNHIAEQLLRSLGAEDGIGTDAAGARAERAFLSAIEVPAEGLRIVDGSGLAPGDRASARTLAGLLARLAGLPDGPEFIRDLPRAGIEGTVRYHAFTDAAGRVRAKSGHIDGVNALAGYVQTRSHGRVAFAFIVNRPSLDDDAVERTYDRALDRLSEF